jgi:hypothetical protein
VGAPLLVPDTGGAQRFVSVSVPLLSLAAGEHTFRVCVDRVDPNGSGSIKGLSLTRAGAASAASLAPVTGVRVTEIGPDSARVSWSAAPGPLSAARYGVYANGVLVATVEGATTVLVGKLQPKTRYSFTVRPRYCETISVRLPESTSRSSATDSRLASVGMVHLFLRRAAGARRWGSTGNVDAPATAPVRRA